MFTMIYLIVVRPFDNWVRINYFGEYFYNDEII